MIKWLLRGKLRKVVESDIVDARSMLATLKLKFHKEGDEVTRLCGEGVGEVAGILAQRLSISVPDALAGRGLSWRQLSDVARDLIGAAQRAQSLLDSPAETARAFSHKQTMGCVVLYHLYRLRFLAEQAPKEQQAEAAAMAARVAEFARIMAEIACGIRDPSDAYR